MLFRTSISARVVSAHVARVCVRGGRGLGGRGQRTRPTAVGASVVCTRRSDDAYMCNCCCQLFFVWGDEVVVGRVCDGMDVVLVCECCFGWMELLGNFLMMGLLWMLDDFFFLIGFLFFFCAIVWWIREFWTYAVIYNLIGFFYCINIILFFIKFWYLM